MILDLFFDELYEEESVITTERLTLRLMREEDAKDIFEIRGNDDVICAPGVPCMESIEDAKKYINRWCEDSVVIVLGEEVIGLIESYVDSELLFDSTFLGYYLVLPSIRLIEFLQTWSLYILRIFLLQLMK